MATWSELQDELEQIQPEGRGDFVAGKSRECIEKIAELFDRNVVYYASGFLQKPSVPNVYTGINMEDINGFMGGIHGHETTKGLLLILHTPGGSAEAAQTIMEYLRSKFNEIDALIPTYAMSAGTMIALGCDRIIMGRQSQLGPTDPQLAVGDRSFSAHSIVEQFQLAKNDIAANAVLAHAWAPVLSSFGPALLQEARKSIGYGKDLVQGWLEKYMFERYPNATELAKEAAEFFGSHKHGSHGRRISRELAREYSIDILDLEANQDLQDEVLTLYHLATIAFEQGPAVKSVLSSNGRMWIKNIQQPGVAQDVPAASNRRNKKKRRVSPRKR